MKECQKPVKYQYAWGGQLKTACEKHMQSIQTVAQVIGTYCDAQPIISDEKCKVMDDDDA